MIYRVVIIDDEDNEVSLTEKDGVRSMDGVGDVDTNLMVWALENLMKAYQGGEKDDTNDN